MLFFSGCKINLGLRILRKRPDGFHDIETIFYPVPWNDVIEYQPSDKTQIEIFGKIPEGNTDDNTVIKAYNLLKKNHELPPLHFMLLKNIPSGAGLGGGSANAAAVLKKLNEDFNLRMTENGLVDTAAAIGSDCAFFIRNNPCLATGRGEVMNDVDVDLKNFWLLILYPGIHVNTAWAYESFSDTGYHQAVSPLIAIIHQPVETWKENLKNDFEDVVFNAHPKLKVIKEKLYDAGSVYASMSGSGSAVFGLFREKPDEMSVVRVFEIQRSDVFLTRLA